MNWLSFFAALIGHLAWPAVVVFLTLKFHVQIAGLIERIHKIKQGETELTFDPEREIEHVEQSVDAAGPPPPLTHGSTAMNPTLGTDLFALATANPREAVSTAWERLCAAIYPVVSHDLYHPGLHAGAVPGSPSDVVQRVRHSARLGREFSTKEADALRELEHFEAQVGRHRTSGLPGEPSVTADQARRYVESAERFAEAVRGKLETVAVG